MSLVRALAQHPDPSEHAAKERVADRCLQSLAGMANPDRAFRALAQSEPADIVALTQLVAPELLADGEVSELAVQPTQLAAIPPELVPDWVASVGSSVLHVECQSYRDTDFLERLFYYHLHLVIRHRPRRVQTLALWLIPPPASQRSEELTRDNVTVRVRSVALAEVPAQLLLSRKETACFAAGANAGQWTEQELCEHVAQALVGASFAQMHMAALAALLRGRYELLIAALRTVKEEVPSMDEFIRYGEDRGMEKGLKKGFEQGLEKGLEKGLEQGRAQSLALLTRQLERKLERSLQPREREVLAIHLREESPEALADRVLDQTPAELAQWLAANTNDTP